MPSRILPMFALVVTMSACSSERRETAADPTYRDDVGDLLRAKCARCHAGSAAPAGWSAERFVDVVACTASGTPVTVQTPDAGDAPLVAVLARPDHAALVSESEVALLRRWVAAGAPAIRAGVHAPSFVDPRSPTSHGAMLRAKQYAPLRDPEDKEACRRCHAGALPPGAGADALLLPAPGATPCTTCHTDVGGPFACTTCHGTASARGTPGHAYPPRDPCFHPEARASDAHPAHAGPSAARAEGLACSTCHPTPALGVLAPPHTDGFVSVWLDPNAKGKGDVLPAFDASTKTCTGTCHARGGARPAPAWTERGMTCNDCHRSPPPAHYEGACSSCHREANADGTALTKPVLHVNGRVDLGDGSGACGACHGRGADPWPTTGAHPAHETPRWSKPVACETCHDVPGPNEAHPVGTGGAAVHLGGLALAGARPAAFDPTTKTCGSTYCHAYVGGTLQTPAWYAGPSQAACGTCHSAPPPLPHVQEKNCAASGCHEGLTATDASQVTPLGRLVHVDGVVDRHAK